MQLWSPSTTNFLSILDILLQRLKESESKGYVIQRHYPRELKKFVVTFVVREIFNNVLPHEKTIRKWYNSIDASPGHVGESYDFMRKKCIKPEAACLSIDDMHIMKRLEKCGTTSRNVWIWVIEQKANSWLPWLLRSWSIPCKTNGNFPLARSSN